jgi:hypothetical protein
MSDRGIAVVSALAAIIGIPISILIYRFSQERKHLDYEFLSVVRLLADQATRLAGELELRFKGDVIKDPYLLLVRLINTGNKPLEVEDFEQPIRIDLDVPVLSAWVAKAEPKDFAPDLSWRGNSVFLPGALFNQGDWVAVSVLADGEPKERSVGVRIVGVKEPRKFQPNAGRIDEMAVPLGWVIGFSSLVLLVVSLNPITKGKFEQWGKLPQPPWQYYALGILATAISIAIGIIVARQWRRLFRKRIESMEVVP